MSSNRFLPLFIPLLVFSLFQAYFFNPKLVYLIAVLSGLLIFFALWQFSRKSEIDKRWWNYLILPAMMATATLAYSVFSGSRYFIQLLFIFNLVFLYLYLRYVYYYLLKPSAYDVFSIENLSSYLNWLTFFLAAATIYGLQSFLNLPLASLIMIMLGAALLMSYQMLWACKIELKAGLLYILISCLIIVELSWSISFLPFNYNISGLALAICYYVILGLVRNHLLLKLDAKKVKMYLLLGLSSLFLILFTAKWL